MSALSTFRAKDGYQRWMHWTEWPLVVLGLAFLAVLILPLTEPLTGAETRGLDASGQNWDFLRPYHSALTLGHHQIPRSPGDQRIYMALRGHRNL